MKKSSVLLLSIVLLFVSLGTANASNYERVSSSASMANQLVDVNGVKDINLDRYFQENQVPKEKQILLKEKVKNNELWDAYKPEMQQWIPSDFFVFDPKLGDQIKYYRFPDGSFISVGTEAGTNSKIHPLGSSTDEYGNITYWDIKISKTVGTASAYVYADFLLGNYEKGYKSKIFRLYGPNASGFGVTDTPKTEIVREVEDIEKSRSALARSYWFSKANLKFSWEGNGIDTTIGTTCSLWLGAIRGKLYVDTKLPY